jgi:pimeloyl-ACP methyl ester carboxylesterase
VRPGSADDAALTHTARPASTASADAARRIESTDGVRVALHDLGGDGPALLLCHATVFHGRVWQPVADHLPDRHSLALDFRGHGDSPLPASTDIDWRGFADDVLAVVDALGLEHVRAAGHSKGGAALLLAEQARPGTFAAIYCYEPIVFPPMPESFVRGENPLAAGARKRRAAFASFDEAEANFASKPPLDVLHPDALRAYVRDGFWADGDGVVHLKCRPEIEARAYEMGGRHDGFARLGEIRCPVTVARGRPEEFGPAAVAPQIADALPNGRLEEHPDLGHFGPLEAPATIAASIDAALPRR